MKVIIIAFLVIIPIISMGQENLLGKTDSQIKLKLSETTAIFDQTTYTNAGDKISFFKYPYEHYLLMAQFIYDENGFCKKCVYVFKKDDELNQWVQTIEDSKYWEKIPGEFAYLRSDGSCFVKFKINVDEHNFELSFNTTKGI